MVIIELHSDHHNHCTVIITHINDYQPNTTHLKHFTLLLLCTIRVAKRLHVRLLLNHFRVREVAGMLIVNDGFDRRNVGRRDLGQRLERLGQRLVGFLDVTTASCVLPRAASSTREDNTDCPCTCPSL